MNNPAINLSEIPVASQRRALLNADIEKFLASGNKITEIITEGNPANVPAIKKIPLRELVKVKHKRNADTGKFESTGDAVIDKMLNDLEGGAT